MKNLKILVCLLILALIQSTTLNYFMFFRVKPELMLICLVLLGLFLNWRWALAYSLFLGFLKDIFGVYPFGVNMLLFVFWAYLLKVLSRKVAIEDNLILVALIFILVILNSISNRLILFFCGKIIPLGIFLRVSLIEAVYTAIFMPLVFKAFSYFKFFLQNKEESTQEIFY